MKNKNTGEDNKRKNISDDNKTDSTRKINIKGLIISIVVMCLIPIYFFIYSTYDNAHSFDGYNDLNIYYDISFDDSDKLSKLREGINHMLSLNLDMVRLNSKEAKDNKLELLKKNDFNIIIDKKSNLEKEFQKLKATDKSNGVYKKDISEYKLLAVIYSLKNRDETYLVVANKDMPKIYFDYLFDIFKSYKFMTEFGYDTDTEEITTKSNLDDYISL